ncbi:MAG: hypothetical protein ACYTEV_10995 [Planctomycetota bacterium]|jgi:hypothetical protein
MDGIEPDREDDADEAEATAEATERQLAVLRDLGVSEDDCQGLAFDEAEAWIEQLLAVREQAGRYGRE